MEQVTAKAAPSKPVYELIGKIIAGNEGQEAAADERAQRTGTTGEASGTLKGDLLKIDPERPVKPTELREFAQEFHQLMMIYKSAASQIAAKIEILGEECEASGKRKRIEAIKQRIKSPDSIATKLREKGVPFTFQSMTRNLADIAGVRVICPYISDIYAVRESLLRQPDVHLVKQKDYIAHPKKSGYRSLHLVVETAVYLSETKHVVPVEIQLRTIAMDFWASLEHELRYKTASSVPRDIKKELCRCADTIARTDRQMEQIALRLRALD